MSITNIVITVTVEYLNILKTRYAVVFRNLAYRYIYRQKTHSLRGKTNTVGFFVVFG